MSFPSLPPISPKTVSTQAQKEPAPAISKAPLPFLTLQNFPAPIYSTTYTSPTSLMPPQFFSSTNAQSLEISSKLQEAVALTKQATYTAFQPVLPHTSIFSNQSPQPLDPRQQALLLQKKIPETSPTPHSTTFTDDDLEHNVSKFSSTSHKRPRSEDDQESVIDLDQEEFNPDLNNTVSDDAVQIEHKSNTKRGRKKGKNSTGKNSTGKTSTEKDPLSKKSQRKLRKNTKEKERRLENTVHAERLTSSASSISEYIPELTELFEPHLKGYFEHRLSDAKENGTYDINNDKARLIAAAIKRRITAEITPRITAEITRRIRGENTPATVNSEESEIEKVVPSKPKFVSNVIRVEASKLIPESPISQPSSTFPLNETDSQSLQSSQIHQFQAMSESNESLPYSIWPPISPINLNQEPHDDL